MIELPTEANPVTVVCGDSCDVLRELPDGCVDAVVTDPPYGIGKNRATARPSNYQRRAGMRPREWDNQTPSLTAIVAIAPVAVVWGGNYFALPPSRCWFAWIKPDAVPSMANVELAWTNLDANARNFSCSIAATNAERVGHPTQKPLALMRWCIRQLPLPPNAIILDPFGGSGTTAVAALHEGRRCIIVERDPDYCDIIRRRVADAQGVGKGSFLVPAAGLFDDNGGAA